MPMRNRSKPHRHFSLFNNFYKLGNVLALLCTKYISLFSITECDDKSHGAVKGTNFAYFAVIKPTEDNCQVPVPLLLR